MYLSKRSISVILIMFFLVTQCFFAPYGMVFAEEPVLDTEAPTAPADLALVSSTDSTVQVSWTSSTDNVGVLEYDIYRDDVLTGTTNDITFTDTNLLPETMYSYTVKARDAAGNQSDASNVLQVTTDSLPDVEAPTAPSNLILLSKTDVSVEISWDTSMDNIGVTGYDIFEQDTLIDESVTGSAFTATGLTQNTDYFFTVKARDEAGNISEASNTLNVKTLLSTPQNITSEVFTTKVVLSWDSVDGADMYDVEIDGIVTESTTSASFTHHSLLSETQHNYRIRAKNTYGESVWSQEFAATTGVLPVPPNIASTQTFTSITISWEAVNEADEYDIEADGILVANVSGMQYEHYELLPNTPHTYKIRARNSGGASAWSDLLTITTTSYGTGTAVDTFIITTKEQLNEVRNNLSAHYRLGSDIDLEGMEWNGNP